VKISTNYMPMLYSLRDNLRNVRNRITRLTERKAP
jgi:hypothetical protein